MKTYNVITSDSTFKIKANTLVEARKLATNHCRREYEGESIERVYLAK